MRVRKRECVCVCEILKAFVKKRRKKMWGGEIKGGEEKGMS